MPDPRDAEEAARKGGAERGAAVVALGEACYRWMVATARSHQPNIHDRLPPLDSNNGALYRAFFTRNNHRVFGWLRELTEADAARIAAFEAVADFDDWTEFREPPSMRNRAKAFPLPSEPRTFTRSDGVTLRVHDKAEGIWRYNEQNGATWFGRWWPRAYTAADARGLLALWDETEEGK